MKWIKFLLLIWNLKKETKYILDNGKIPMCYCNKYYKTGNCKHLDKLRVKVKKNMQLKNII